MLSRAKTFEWGKNLQARHHQSASLSFVAGSSFNMKQLSIFGAFKVGTPQQQSPVALPFEVRNLQCFYCVETFKQEGHRTNHLNSKHKQEMAEVSVAFCLFIFCFNPMFMSLCSL